MRRCVIYSLVMCLCVPFAFGGETAKTDAPEGKPEKTAAYYHELAQIHAGYKKVEQASECFKKAAELAEHPSKRSEYIMELGGMLIENGRPEEARDTFFDAIKSAEGHERLKLCRSAAKACEKAEEMDLAGEILKKSIELAEGSRERSTARLQYLLWLKQTDQVDEIATAHLQTLKKNPRDPDALEWMAGYYLMIENSVEKGLMTYEKLLKVRPNDPDLLEELAVLYLARKQNDKAIKMYKRMAEADESRAVHAYEQLATIASLAGKPEQAIEWNKKMFAKGAATPKRLQRQAKLYRRVKDYKGAVDCLEKALDGNEKRDVQTDTLRLQLARMYKLVGRKQDAIKLARKLADTTSSQRLRRSARQELTRLTAEKETPPEEEPEQ